MRSPIEVAHEVATSYLIDTEENTAALATLASLARVSYRGLWRFLRVVFFLVGAWTVYIQTSFFPPLYKQVAKVAKVANRRISEMTPTIYGEATSGGDLGAPEKVATAYPCVRCPAYAGPDALLCPACYAKKRPAKCPSCGGRLVAGRCGWC